MKKRLTLDEFLEYTLIMLIIAAIALVGNWVSSKFTASFVDSIPGILILLGIALVGTTLAKVIPLKIPAIIWITVIGILLAAFGLGLLVSCLFTSGFLLVMAGLLFLGLGLFLFLR